MKKSANRNAGIELLRIFAMLMIVTIHFFSFGRVSPEEGTANYFFSNFFLGASQCGVNIFFIISGYFLINSSFKLSRVVNIWLETVFYSLLWCVVLIVKSRTFSLSFLSAFIPFTSNSYWFVTNYLLILLLFPFLNRFILDFDKTKTFIGMVVLFVAFCLIPSIFPSSSVIPYLSFGGGYDIVWSVICYLTGAYIRVYAPKIRKRTQIICLMASLFLIPLSVTFLHAIRDMHNAITDMIYIYIFKEKDSIMISYSSVFVYAASISLFLIFKDIRVKSERIKHAINYVASLTFAVYLIHNNDLIIDDLWTELNPSRYENSSFLFVYMIICVLGIFAVCCLLEAARSALSGYLHKKTELESRCQKVQERFIAALDNKIKKGETP